jgi:hypothetical protein
VQHVGAGFGGRRVEAGDLVAADRDTRVALGGQHHGDRRARAPGQRAGPGQAAGNGRGGQQAGQRGFQPVQHDLDLRVAEPCVELDDARARPGQGQARVKHAAEGRAAAAQFAQGRPDDRGQGLAGQAVGGPGQRRVRAHPAGVGPGVAVVRPLEVLRGQQGDRVLPVGQGEHRHLGAVKELLDHHRGGRRGVRQRGRPVRGHQHALARGQPVGLDHVRRAEPVQGGGRLARGAGGHRGRGRDPGGGHHVLGEGFRALDHGRVPERAEAGDPGPGQHVGHTGHQRCFLADDHQPGRQAAGQRADRGRVGGVHLVPGSVRRHSRVARGDVQVGYRRVGGQGPAQRVLAAALADHQDAHR